MAHSPPLDSPVSPIRDTAVLQRAGIAVLAIICIGVCLDEYAKGEGVSTLNLVARLALIVSLCIVYGMCFWTALRQPRSGNGASDTFVLLAVQGGIAALLCLNLLILVCLELPFLLRGRSAWLGLAGVLLVSGGLMVWQAGSMDDTMAFARRASGAGSQLAWQLLAFCGGWLASREARRCAETRELNAALVDAHVQATASGRLQERLRISRELHDTLGHQLAAMHIQLQLAQCGPDDGSRDALQNSSRIARQLLQDVRSTVSLLREDSACSLERELRALAALVPLPRVLVSYDPACNAWPDAARHVLLRCAQEGLANALRHADATQVWISVSARPGEIRLQVKDDGRGAPGLQPGNGFSGLRERLGEVGGELLVESPPGAGLCMTAIVSRREAP